MSAIKLAAQITSGSVKAADLLAATLARIDAEDAALGALTALLDLPTALVQLTQLQANGVGPLQGLSVAVKDIFDTADLPTRYGSALYSGGSTAEQTPKLDAAIVGAVRRAGGLVIGKTSTTEFAYLNPTKTLNPKAPGRTPGGSSAGSAAAVAAGLVPFAVGTQTGGSVIRPASYCGVTGFKPSFGLLPTPGIKCFSWSLDTVGLFANSVPDVAWFAGAVSGFDLALKDTPQKTLRIGVPAAYPWGPVSASAQLAIDRAVAALRRQGAQVITFTLPAWMKDVFDAQDVVQGFEVWRSMARDIDANPHAFSAVLRNYLMSARNVSGAAYEAAQQTAHTARAACTDWFNQIDVLMTPSAPDEAPLGYASTGTSTANRAWTLLGLPCVNVAGAVGVTGHPMGLQIIGGPRADRQCLAAADFVERALQASAPD
jgi:Asp-tRNA(Asn)/Glu-tRNA(Gln) amidotransferase A subunit family amidase